MKECLKLTAREAMSLLSKGEFTPSDLFNVQLQFAKHIEPALGSFLSLASKDSFQATKNSPYSTSLNCLSQIPVSVKDIFATKGFCTTAGSRALEGYWPPYDATPVRLLQETGNQLIGKTNLDEFAMGSSTEYSGYHATRNPWDLSRVPGGSSGGSAASVAALQSFISIGTDTSGSVRQPAAFCGVIGYLPSYGMVSRYGLIAYASSLDQPGIIARSVDDVALTMNAISQPDSLDATCMADGKADFVAECSSVSSVSGAKVGVISELMDPRIVSEDVLARCEEGISNLKSHGFCMVPISIPLVEMLLHCYHILSPAEASSNLARYDGIRYGLGFPADKQEDIQEHYRRVRSSGFGEEVKRRILSGTYVLSAGYTEEYYNRARVIRKQVSEFVAGLFKEVDFLVSPTTPTTAFKLGEKLDDPVAMYAADACTVLASLCSLPAISLPAGLCSGGLPVGIQFIAPRLADAKLLTFAKAFEKAHGLDCLVPPLVGDALARFEG